MAEEVLRALAQKAISNLQEEKEPLVKKLQRIEAIEADWKALETNPLTHRVTRLTYGSPVYDEVELIIKHQDLYTPPIPLAPQAPSFYEQHFQKTIRLRIYGVQFYGNQFTTQPFQVSKLEDEYTVIGIKKDGDFASVQLKLNGQGRELVSVKHNQNGVTKSKFKNVKNLDLNFHKDKLVRVYRLYYTCGALSGMGDVSGLQEDHSVLYSWCTPL
jgi:hypothetical protein